MYNCTYYYYVIYCKMYLLDTRIQNNEQNQLACHSWWQWPLPSPQRKVLNVVIWIIITKGSQTSGALAVAVHNRVEWFSTLSDFGKRDKITLFWPFFDAANILALLQKLVGPEFPGSVFVGEISFLRQFTFGCLHHRRRCCYEGQ